MTIHDWTRVNAGIFHAFHHDWITEISRALNHGHLLADYYALPEQIAGGFGPDVLTLSTATPPGDFSASGGIALADAPPKVELRIRSEARQYAAKAKAVVIRHVSQHRIVAMIEVVSPGNKDSQAAISDFVPKAREALAAGIHLLIIDLFPPTPRDPEGIPHAVWGDDLGDDYALPSDRPLTCVGFLAGAWAEAFVQFVAVDGKLPDMPLFLTPAIYVPVPLQFTYDLALDAMPQYWRESVGSSSPIQ
jgi:hypothetical protein